MTNHNDSIDNQLERADAAQRAAMPTWRKGLSNIFAADSQFSAGEKATALSLPDRRGFLRFGGLTIAGSALLVACGDSDDGASGDGTTTSTTAADGTTTTTAADGTTTTAAAEETTTTTEGAPEDGTETDTPAGGGDMDLVLLRTATSLELAAVAAYQAAIDGAADLGITDTVAQVAVLFQAHHVEHAQALQAATTEVGGTPYEDANPFFMEQVIGPAAAELTDEAGTITFALSLEEAASQTYTFAGGALSTPVLRQTIMSIGGVEARHAAVLRGALDSPQTPNSFNPTSDAAPEESFIEAS